MLKIRKALSNDIHICYEWANEPLVRENSHSKSEIKFSDHEQWFNKKIKDPQTQFYILEQDDLPVGQIRFEGDEIKVISLLLSPLVRGKGLGSIILIKGVEKVMMDSSDTKCIVGYVLPTNIASNKAFLKAGFTLEQPDNIYPDSNKYSLIILGK